MRTKSRIQASDSSARMKKMKEVKKYFPQKFNESDLINFFQYIVNAADKKNSRPSYFSKEVPELVQELEKKFDAEGYDGLTYANSMKFLKEMIDLHAREGVSFGDNYFAHMLRARSQIIGLLGHIEGTLFGGNQVSQEVSTFSNTLEKRISEITTNMYGFTNENSTGLVTMGGTEANHIALLTARNYAYMEYEDFNIREKGFPGLYKENTTKGIATRDPLVILPANKHYSLPKICNDLGIGEANILYIGVDDKMRMDMKDLEDKLSQVNPEEKKILAAISVFGSTETGATDDIKKFRELVEEYDNRAQKKGFKGKIWKHLDAAYGGPHVLTDKYKHLKETMGTFDSLTFDPHKLLFVPYNAGMLLLKDASTLMTISTDAEYIGNNGLNKLTKKEFVEKLFNHTGAVKANGSQLIGGVLSTYYTLKTIGANGIKEVLEHTQEMAQYLAKTITKAKPASGRLEVINTNPDLDLVVFRHLPEQFAQYGKENWKLAPEAEKKKINEYNSMLYNVMKSDKTRYMTSSTTLQGNGITALRTAIQSPHTTKKNIDGLVNEVVQQADDLVKITGYMR